jgi:hypothetical protein
MAGNGDCIRGGIDGQKSLGRDSGNNWQQFVQHLYGVVVLYEDRTQKVKTSFP